MNHALELEIQPQPNDSSCGPTCLAAVYHYWNCLLDLAQVIAETDQVDGGGTLAVQLACHALQRGYEAQITTYNLNLFDPSWFPLDEGREHAGKSDDPHTENGQVSGAVLARKLHQQWNAKRNHDQVDSHRLQVATNAYLEFIKLGGQVQMRPLNESLIVGTLTKGVPILCGLSATYLYQEPRECSQPLDAEGRCSVADDIAGFPAGHFVVLHGYDRASGNVLIADPLHPNPIAPTSKYAAPLSQVTSAVLLGIVTYDANLLTLVPRKERERNLY